MEYLPVHTNTPYNNLYLYPFIKGYTITNIRGKNKPQNRNYVPPTPSVTLNTEKYKDGHVTSTDIEKANLLNIFFTKETTHQLQVFDLNDQGTPMT